MPHRQCLLAQAGLAARAGPQVLPAAGGQAEPGEGAEEARALRRARPRRASCRGWCPSWRGRSWPGSWGTPGRSRACCASCATRTALTAWCGLFPALSPALSVSAAQICRAACKQAHGVQPSIRWSGLAAQSASEPRILGTCAGCAQPPGMRSRTRPCSLSAWGTLLTCSCLTQGLFLVLRVSALLTGFFAAKFDTFRKCA